MPFAIDGHQQRRFCAWPSSPSSLCCPTFRQSHEVFSRAYFRAQSLGILTNMLACLVLLVLGVPLRLPEASALGRERKYPGYDHPRNQYWRKFVKNPRKQTDRLWNDPQLQKEHGLDARFECLVHTRYGYKKGPAWNLIDKDDFIADDRYFNELMDSLPKKDRMQNSKAARFAKYLTSRYMIAWQDMKISEAELAKSRRRDPADKIEEWEARHHLREQHVQAIRVQRKELST